MYRRRVCILQVTFRRSVIWTEFILFICRTMKVESPDGKLRVAKISSQESLGILCVSMSRKRKSIRTPKRHIVLNNLRDIHEIRMYCAKFFVWSIYYMNCLHKHIHFFFYLMLIHHLTTSITQNEVQEITRGVIIDRHSCLFVSLLEFILLFT